MKTFSKIIVILGSAFIVLGIVLGIVAVSLGGGLINNKEMNTVDFNGTYANVTSLYFEIGAGQVNIKTGDEFKVDATGVLANQFESSVNDGVWTIKDTKKFEFPFFTRNNFNLMNYSPQVTIYLPKGFEAENINISLGAGTVNAEELFAQKTDISVGAGALTVQSFKTGESKIDCGVGKVEINGTMAGNSKIHCGVGKIDMQLIGNKNDYDYNVSVGVGNVQINNDNYNGSASKNITNEGAKYNFNLDCGVGSINLQVKEK